jgi:hypothetical protein
LPFPSETNTTFSLVKNRTAVGYSQSWADR